MYKDIFLLVWHASCDVMGGTFPLSPFTDFRSYSMRTLLSIAVLMTAAMPAFADLNFTPEPESLSLLAIGALGLLVALRRKK